jgi:hypothetical protein
MTCGLNAVTAKDLVTYIRVKHLVTVKIYGRNVLEINPKQIRETCKKEEGKTSSLVVARR